MCDKLSYGTHFVLRLLFFLAPLRLFTIFNTHSATNAHLEKKKKKVWTGALITSSHINIKRLDITDKSCIFRYAIWTWRTKIVYIVCLLCRPVSLFSLVAETLRMLQANYYRIKRTKTRFYHFSFFSTVNVSPDWHFYLLDCRHENPVYHLISRGIYRSCPILSISSIRKSMSEWVAAGLDTTMRKKLTLLPWGW